LTKNLRNFTRQQSKIIHRGRSPLGMAKQRHAFAIPDDDSDKTFSEQDGGHSINYHKRRPRNSWFLFAVMSFLIFLVFFLNVFQFEFVSSFYSESLNLSRSENGIFQEPKHYCEYDGGPLFYNLRTSLGVSYEGGHW
jgi:hypothetical protein